MHSRNPSDTPGTSNTATDPERGAGGSFPGAGPRFCSQEGSRVATGGNPAGTRLWASPGVEGHSHTWPDGPFPAASVSWSEQWDQHTQAKEVGSRKLEKKHPIPSSRPPKDRGSTRTFLGACQPHPPSAAGTDPVPLLSGPGPSHLPSVHIPGSGTGAADGPGGGVWLAVLFGWKQRPFWRGQGLTAQLGAFPEPVWAQCSQPRATPQTAVLPISPGLPP